MPHDGMLMSVTKPSGAREIILAGHHFLCCNFFQRKADFLWQLLSLKQGNRCTDSDRHHGRRLTDHERWHLLFCDQTHEAIVALPCHWDQRTARLQERLDGSCARGGSPDAVDLRSGSQGVRNRFLSCANVPVTVDLHYLEAGILFKY
jgi:hypothetical protein